MAIAFARAGAALQSTATATSGTVTVTINTGECGVLVFCIGGNTATTSGFGISAITGGGTWSRAVRAANAAAPSEVVEIWTCATVTTSITSLSVTWTRGDSTAPAMLLAGAYTGVAAIGATATAAITPASTAPSILLTTQDANNYVVAGFIYSSASSSAAATVSVGTIRLQKSDGSANTVDVLGVFTDNTAAASNTSVQNKITGASNLWQVAAVELRSTTGGTTTSPRGFFGSGHAPKRATTGLWVTGRS